MGAKGEGNRQRIVDAANQLFYHKGYNQTSFSDIAEVAGLSRGNFYYYFKTKDDILFAVIEHRIESTRNMLTDWERQYANPRQRLQRFVRMLSQSEQDILRYGCPMGSLTTELSKNQFSLHSKAREMFELFRHWLEAQFAELGQPTEARMLALHLLALTQGVSLIGNVYSDPQFLNNEIDRLVAWIDSV